ncbi:serine carboxypeptidase [Teladorsagia circumcincta]|uniref:Serine carboxypeptidase n=1 Tax=Teladorsagia circumcincta TaxID=45464 RepID=A0A2G9V3I5_TELCI|nr:serine carboxypeptidase [Teladorsagia circumcincta]
MLSHKGLSQRIQDHGIEGRHNLCTKPAGAEQAESSRYASVDATLSLPNTKARAISVPTTSPIFLPLKVFQARISATPCCAFDYEDNYANIVYLDAPAGVGFSVRSDGFWNYTDTEVASDNYVALKECFKKFPERRTNDFYAAGESYAGTYIPMLSAFLVDDLGINFKGMLIGNGCIDDILNFNSLVDFNYNHGFIDERYYRQSIEKCCNNNPDHCDFYNLSMNETGFCYDELQPACAHHNDSVVYLQRDDVRAALQIPNNIPAYETCKESNNRHLFAKLHFSIGPEGAAKFRKQSHRAVINWDSFTTLGNLWEDSSFKNIDEKYYRFVEHLHASGGTLVVTKRHLSPETLELISQRETA